VVVNAAGPWVERVAGLAPPGEPDGSRLRLGPTKGVHLLLPRLTRDHAIAFQAERDGRIMFLLPWHDCTLVGTTDTDYRGSPDDVRATPADVAYLLAEVRRLVPGSAVTESDVITAFAGLRPLLKADAAHSNAPSARSREHRLVRQGANLLTVAGGKYTTYRAIAAEVTDEVYRLLGDRHPPACRTADTPIPDPRPDPAGALLAECPAMYESDVAAACDAEAAVTVTDVMRRRTGLALGRFGGADVADAVSRVMAGRLGWDEPRRATSVREYLDERARELPA
jgi:glycerol-3-phosphate dehydrogenase